MYFVHIVFVSVCSLFVIYGIDTAEEINRETPTANQQQSDSYNYNFVTLIDISYTDGTKRICTGTIVHENVVVTAAHCFKPRKRVATPELTTSFIVIGTGAQFESGKEQYELIERVMYHPGFKDYKHDICLVFTFGSLTARNRSKIISIAGRQTAIPDVKVNMFSWGPVDDDVGPAVTSSSFKHATTEKPKVTVHKIINSYEDSFERPVTSETHHNDNDNTRTPYPPRRGTQIRSIRNRYLSAVEEKNSRLEELKKELSYESKRTLDNKKIYNKIESRFNRYNHAPLRPGVKERVCFGQNCSVHFTRWRRSMNTQIQQLTVVPLTVTSNQACKNLIEETLKPKYVLGESFFYVCYSSESAWITNLDSGAAIVQMNKAAAIAMRSMEGDVQIVLGLKLCCYCAWIISNLPKPLNSTWSCTKSCCNPHSVQISPNVNASKETTY